MAYSYGIPDGNYVGKPTTASFYEKDGKLILDVKFAVRDPATGDWFKKDNGYEWEAQKRHWITTKDGAFNEATINGIKEWAKGWNCTDLSSFYWFQSPDENGVPFGHLSAIGEVRLAFQTHPTYGQTIWVHDPNRTAGAARKAFAPDGAVTDKAALLAKWGAKAKAVFASTPRKVETPTAPAPTPVPAPAPTRPAPAPAAKSAAKPWADCTQTADGAFAYYCSLLGEEYSGAKHDAKWFEIYDAAAQGKDPDQMGAADVQHLFAAVYEAMKK